MLARLVFGLKNNVEKLLDQNSGNAKLVMERIA